MQAPLPPSWGSSPEVLPRLRDLALHLPFTGGLPPQWGAGFASLKSLLLTSSVGCITPYSSLNTEEPLGPRPPVRLPAEWAAGFRRLTYLNMDILSLEGSLDEVWADAFPSVEEL